MTTEKKQHVRGNLLQFIKFGLVGAVNTILYYLVYFLYISFVPHPYNYLVAQFLGFFISVFGAYLLNGRFVFKVSPDGAERVWWKVLIKTYMSYGLTGLVLNTLLLWLWIDVVNIGQYLGWLTGWLNGLGLSLSSDMTAKYIAPIINLAASVPINFLVNKFWAFGQKQPVTQADSLT